MTCVYKHNHSYINQSKKLIMVMPMDTCQVLRKIVSIHIRLKWWAKIFPGKKTSLAPHTLRGEEVIVPSPPISPLPPLLSALIHKSSFPPKLFSLLFCHLLPTHLTSPPFLPTHPLTFPLFSLFFCCTYRVRAFDLLGDNVAAFVGFTGSFCRSRVPTLDLIRVF